MVLTGHRLVICAYQLARLLLYDVDGGRPKTLAPGCRTGVVRLAGGDLAFAGDGEVRHLKPDLGAY